MNLSDVLGSPRIKDLALDIVELIPDWSPFAIITPIKRLRSIRNAQRMDSKQSSKYADHTGSARPELHVVSIGYTVELEDAEFSAAILRGLFGDQPEIIELVNAIKSEVTRLLPGRSALVGMLRKTINTRPLGAERVFEDMPNGISEVAVYYTRFTNSIACISMKCLVTKELAESLTKAEDDQGISVSKWTWLGVDGILFGTGRYSIIPDEAEKEAIKTFIGNIAEQFHYWISAKCQQLKSPMLRRSIFASYIFEAGLGQSGNLQDKAKNCSRWLSRYGISHPNTFTDNRSILGCQIDSINSFYCPFVLLQPRPLPLELPQSDEQIVQSSYLADLQSCLAIASALMCEVEHLVGAIEESRREVYRYIEKKQHLSTAGSKIIVKQKRLDGQAKRLEHEINGTYTNILTSILKPLGDFQSLHEVHGERLDAVLLEGTRTRLIIASKAGSLASETASEYLEAQNIFASYRLQEASSRIGCASLLLALLSLISLAPNLRDLSCGLREARALSTYAEMLCQAMSPGKSLKSNPR